jgi:hypothetical protein
MNLMRTKPAANDAKWEAVTEEIRSILTDIARQGLPPISYSELCRHIQTASIHYHSHLLTRLLIEVGRREMEAGRPVLPALVVSKQSGIPGPGYFKVADSHDSLPDADARQQWQADLDQVYAYWSKY